MSQGIYWIVACSGSDNGREGTYSVLKSRVLRTQLVADTAIFEVPLNLTPRSFDELMRLVDDFAKYDTQCENILRRLERQTLDVDPAAEFRIMWQRNTMTIDQYIRRFAWDDGRYPRHRRIKENLEILMSSVVKFDDEVRVKTAAFNEVKQQHTSTSKKDSMSLIQRDLIDVLTPEVVSAGDFVETDHLTTLCVVVPRGQENAFLACYESLENFVVPRSALKFPSTDNDGNTLWRVILFRKCEEAFKTAARAKRFFPRDFTYNADAFYHKIEERSKLEAEKSKQETFLSRVCLAAFSDVFVAWMHLKAMRVFVEAVLRFGVPPNFNAFFLYVTNPSKEKKLRKELDDIFTTKGMFGKSFIEGADNSTMDAALAAELGEEEYHPYVSLYLTPFQSFVQK